MPVTVDSAVWTAFFADNPDPCFAYAVEPDRRFTMVAVNAAWTEVTGLPESVVGKSLDQLMPPEMVAFITERLDNCARSQRHQSFDEELRFKREPRFWRTTLAPVVVDGRTRYIIGFGHDYTD